MKDIYGINPSFEFISSGSTMIDLVLGGGYPLGRISNVIGQSGSGKSACAIEACANFSRTYPDGKIVYVDTESAFDEEYAQVIGFPREKANLERDITTLEGLRDFMNADMDKRKKDIPALYILDSLDGISDVKAEENFETGKGNYGTKAKVLAEFLKYFDKKLEDTKTHFMIVSQIRKNINAGPYGSPYIRSGGEALQFYCSQVLWIHPAEKVDETIKGNKMVFGQWVKIKNSKNRIASPFRECYALLMFKYGIDNLSSCLSFLYDSSAKYDSGFEGLTKDEYLKTIKKKMRSNNPEDHQFLRDANTKISNDAIDLWKKLESELTIRFTKY